MKRDPRRSGAARSREYRSQSHPLDPAELVGNQQYVALLWTCSKVEPDPMRAHDGACTEGEVRGLPVGYGAAAVCTNEDQLRRRPRTPHDAVTGDRKQHDKIHRPG